MEKEGKIHLLFDMTESKGETAKGWIADYIFDVRSTVKSKKMAVVGDTTWEKFLMELAKIIYAPHNSKERQNAKFFKPADINKAWGWIRE